MTQSKQTTRFALLFLLYFLGASVALSMAAPLQQLPYHAYQSLAQLVCLVPPCCLYFLRTKKPLRQTLRLNPLGMKNALLVLAFAVAVQPVMGFLSLITSFFFPNPVVDASADMLDGSYLAAVLSTAILPAVLEELPNRGILLSGYRYLGKEKAAFVSALFFAFLHLNPQQFLYTFAIGYCFSILVERTDSIYASILAHFTINGSTVLTLFSGAGEEAATMEVSSEMLLITNGALALLSLPIVLLIFYLLFRLNPPKAEIPLLAEDGKPYREGLLSMPFIALCTIYVAFGLLPYLTI